MGSDISSTLFLSSVVGSVVTSSYFSTSAGAKKGSFLLKNAVGKSIAAEVLSERSASQVDTDTNATIGRELIKKRESQLGPNVSVFYKQDGGLVVEKGSGVYLIDIGGNKHLDCCNNVACVGHSSPKVVKAGKEALSSIQTNSRFLHRTQQLYLDQLLKTFPKELNTVYMVNSGTEANDLALRIARAHAHRTSKKPDDVICLDYAYHGHSQATFDISPYKWAQAIDGRNYQPSTTHVVDCPDSYRGKYRGMSVKTGAAYAKDVADVISKNGGMGVFIAESIVGCGGQIVLPPTYLQNVYTAVRKAGGVCIADEVQTGFARSGTHYWAFEAYGVVPDIVTVGKPMGNGYPVAAVIVRREIAESFAASGIEYFNTYGGNSVACSIGKAVMDVIEEKKLQKNALKIGKAFQVKMKSLQKKFDWIGDVRGMGLFQGVEFIKTGKGQDPLHPEPHPDLTKFVVDFLKYENVIISRDGPDENVIKLKPPLVFGRKHVEVLVNALERALSAAVESGRF